VLKKMQKMNAAAPMSPMVFAWAYLGHGDKDKTLELMYEAYEQHSNVMTSLKVEPAFDPLRNDPRFIELLHRVRLDR
jgi:hypothetical protein